VAGHKVSLTGTVQDGNPARVPITFSGVASGTTYTDANGNYSYTTTATGLGTVNAMAVDSQNRVSPPCSAEVAKPLPQVSLNIMCGSQKTVTLWGMVNDVDAGGRTVTFSGVVSGSVVTASDGSFSYTATASGLGNVTAGTIDLWAQASPGASVTVSVKAPVISGLTAYDTGTVCTFSGKVSAQSPQGLTVTFSGLAAVSGDTATVNSDGSFSLTVQWPANTTGTVYVQITDWWGQLSNQAAIFV
jgi:hypothetical protein